MYKYHIYGSLPQNICDVIEKAHNEVIKTPELLGSLWWEKPHITVVYGIVSDVKIDNNVNSITNNFIEKFKELKEVEINLGSVHIKIREKMLILCLTVSSNILNDIITHFINSKLGTFNFKCNELHITIGIFKNTNEGILKAYEIANMFRSELEEKTIKLNSIQFVDNDDVCHDIIKFKNDLMNKILYIKDYKTNLDFFINPIKKLIGEETKENIHFLFSPDFTDKIYEIYFDLVDKDYEIDVKDFDSSLKQSYMKHVFMNLYWNLIDIYNEKFGITNYTQLINMNNSDKFFPSPLQYHSIYQSEKQSEKMLGLICKEYKN